MSIQDVIDNASAVSFNRESTFAVSTSQSRQLKYFRRGPIQSVAEVRMNTVTADQWRPIFGAISKDKLGPYDVSFPKEVVGEGLGSLTLLVDGVGQTGSTINISSVHTSQVVLNAGDIIQFPGVAQVYVVVDDITTDAQGDAAITIDNPLVSSPTNGGTVLRGTDSVFSMFLTEQPDVSQGPTGLVGTNGTFRFTEEY